MRKYPPLNLWARRKNLIRFRIQTQDTRAFRWTRIETHGGRGFPHAEGRNLDLRLENRYELHPSSFSSQDALRRRRRMIRHDTILAAYY